MDAVISVHDVWKRFVLKKDRSDSVGQLLFRMVPRLKRGTPPEPFWALRDVSFDLGPGRSLGIVGDNGSGKSTLLKILTRTMLPTRGSVEVRGKVSALIELGAGFHPDFTGRENVFMNASILGLTRREVQMRLPEIVDFAELWEFIDTPVKYYSSGMNARLGFAVATAVHPEVLIVDEVLAVGDETFQKKCMNKIVEMKQNGVSILLVSHVLSAISDLMDEAIWLDHGEMKALGDPESVIRAYRNKRSGEDVASENDPRQSAAANQL